MGKNRILVVEDESIVALNIKKQLEINGYEVPGVFATGEEAITAFPAIRPDLVLMDILLKGEMDGIQSAELLRTKYNVPVVLITAYADEETINRAKYIEPFGYIVKPFTERDLRLTIELALYRRKMETERKQLEEQLRHAQKMEAIGRLAGGIAHDFNNIVTVVMGYTSLAREKAAENSSVEYELQGIHQAALKASNLTRQLLTFSKGQPIRHENIDLHNLIKNMENMIRRLMSGYISIHLHLNANNSCVNVDPGQMEQVLLNLAVNASDAMPAGGRLVIATENENGYLILSVTDTGKGIDQDIKSKIFEPFFTTKSDREGTGLGLATVYSVVQQSGGSIKVRSAEGKGSTFQITLPMCERTAEKSKNQPTVKEQPGGKEMILLVEDEKLLRELLTQFLARVGYTVFPASNAGEAILIFENQDSRIDLLITDIVMPHMNGKKLAERLSNESSSLKVLLISGYVDEQFTEESILKKPFPPAVLLKRVREILDGVQ